MVARRRRRESIGSSSVRSEGLPLDINEDEEVQDLNMRVVDIARAPAPLVPRTAPNTPSSRLESVRNRASGYEREYRLKLLHRLIMRGIALDVIADEFQVSVRTVIRDRDELYRRLRNSAAKMDANKMIGDTIGFYEETQAIAMKLASADKIPANIKLASIRTALTSRNDRHRFYKHSGIFDVLQFQSDEDATSNDLDRLMELTDRLMVEDKDLDGIASDHGIDIDDLLDDEDAEHNYEIQMF